MDLPPSSFCPSSPFTAVVLTKSTPPPGVNSRTGPGSSAGARSAIPNFSSFPMETSAVKYRECLRNHAASRGGHIVDGCGEFMPFGPGNEALKCAACGCHRSFHRKELPEGFTEHNYNSSTRVGVVPVVPFLLPSPQSAPPPNASASGGTTTESSSEERLNLGTPNPAAAGTAVVSPGRQGSKKRFRTKFSPEQKERMMEYAERVGWRVQPQNDPATEQFCVEVGITRQVLKVWMHNNKHTVTRQLQAASPEIQLQLQNQPLEQQLQQQHLQESNAISRP